MPPFLLVFLGGGLGALARFGLVALVKPQSPAFPTGTLIVNLSGCLAIGLVAGWLARAAPPLSAAITSAANSAPLAAATAATTPTLTTAGTAPGTTAAWSAEHWRLLLMVGILGGYTTFSSFGLEVADMLRAGRAGAAITYILASVFGGVLLTLLGLLPIAVPARTP